MDIPSSWYILGDTQYMDHHSIPEYKHMNQLHLALNKLHLYHKVLDDIRELVHLRFKKYRDWEEINWLKFNSQGKKDSNGYSELAYIG